MERKKKHKDLNMSVLKSEKGFSLAEVMIGAGLLGILTVGMNYGFDLLNKQKKNSRTKLTIQSQLNVGLKYMAAHTNGLSWKVFDFDNTYYQATNMKEAHRVSWDAGDVDNISNRSDLIQTFNAPPFGNVSFYMDSFTLVKEKGGSNGLYFSRCVSESDYTSNKNFGLQEALDLPNRPYLLSFDNMKYVYCAPRATNGSVGTSYRINGRKTNYRVMSFYYKNKTWKQMPGPEDRKSLLGAGFMLYMNRNENPESFISYSFVLDDPCYRYDTSKDCQRLPIISLRNLSGPIQETGVHDSGFMIIQ